MSVLTYPEGKPIDWFNPPKATTRVMWDRKSQSGQDVTGSLFAIAALDSMSAKAQKKYGVPVTIIQPAYNTGVAASAGTHDRDFCMDWWIAGVDGLEQQRFARFENGWCDWFRQPWQGFSYHQHGFPMPPGGHKFPTKVGIYVDGGISTEGRLVTSSQLDDYWDEAYGLKDRHYQSADPTPFPTDEQKLKAIFNLDRYITKQQEEDMSYEKWTEEGKKAYWDDFENVFMQRLHLTLKKDPRGAAGDKEIPMENALERLLNGNSA
jgi:hypothetical protein